MSKENKHRAHRRGRPTKTGQLKNRQSLRKYFEQDLSADHVAQETGMDIKTVYRYYDEFAEQLEEFETRDFLERQKRDRAQIIISYDCQIAETIEFLTEILEEVEKLRQEKKQIPKHLLGYRIELLKFKSDLVERKNAFVMQPTMDEALEKKIQEEIRQEHERTRTGR